MNYNQHELKKLRRGPDKMPDLGRGPYFAYPYSRVCQGFLLYLDLRRLVLIWPFLMWPDFYRDLDKKRLRTTALRFLIGVLLIYFVILQIFSKHGESQARKSSLLLSHGLRNVLKVDPLLPEDEKIRVMNIFRLENSQFEPLSDVPRIQNALQVVVIYDCRGRP